MSAENSAPDPVDAAIAATSEPERVSFPLTFGGDRAGALILPADIAPGELLGLIAFIASAVTPTLARAQEAKNSAPGLEVPKRPRLFVPN
jgi:hypothetical protein